MNKLNERELILQLFDKYQNFLTQTQKQSIHLYYVEDLSLAEIADVVATSRNAIYDAIKKGKEKLQLINTKINY